MKSFEMSLTEPSTTSITKKMNIERVLNHFQTKRRNLQFSTPLKIANIWLIFLSWYPHKNLSYTSRPKFQTMTPPRQQNIDP